MCLVEANRRKEEKKMAEKYIEENAGDGVDVVGEDEMIDEITKRIRNDRRLLDITYRFVIAMPVTKK